MSTVTWLRQNLGLIYPPIKLYPEDVRDATRYYERINRLEEPVESECSHAIPMFMLHNYTGKTEWFDIDTSTQTLTKLVFFRSYRGQRERFENLDIQPSLKS